MASGNNIEALRVARGWSRPELAKRMVPPTSGQQVERLEKGQRRLAQDWIDRAAAALGVEPATIIAPNIPSVLDQEVSSTGYLMSLAKPVNDDDIVEIERLDLSVSMGPGTIIDDYVEGERVKISHGFVRAITRTPTDRLKIITGIGDSMYPTLSWGDQIMVDLNDRALARQDGIYWISVHGASGLKRLRTIGQGRVLVISDNKTVGDYEVATEDLRIEGRAIWFARGL